MNFTPPGAVHIARISNIGDAPVYVSLVGFPEQYFYTNLTHEDLMFKEHDDREMRIVFKFGNLPEKREYIFQLNDSDGRIAHVAIRLSKGWDTYRTQQKQYIQYKDGQGASPAELHQEAKQLIAAAETKELPAALQESLAGQLLAAAGQPEAAALAYSKAEKEDSKLAERFIAYSSPDVMTDLADAYKKESNIDKEEYWRDLAGKISPDSKRRKHDSDRKDNRILKQSKSSEYETDSDFTKFVKKAYFKNQEDDFRYIDNLDGTITDAKTGLMWKRCSEGLSGVNCSEGKIKKYTWVDTANKFQNVEYAGYADWRLPTIDELKTLVYCSTGREKDDGWCNYGSEKPTINQQAFPNIEAWSYWSGSPAASNSDYAWFVSFSDGYSYAGNRPVVCAVRLVRGGKSQAALTHKSTKEEQALYEWRTNIRYSSSSRTVEQFLQRFPVGSHVQEAQKKLDELRAIGQ